MGEVIQFPTLFRLVEDEPAEAPDAPWVSSPHSRPYRSLGNRAVSNSHSVGLDCDHCGVTWNGCAAECCCPECGAEKDVQTGDCVCEVCRITAQDKLTGRTALRRPMEIREEHKDKE